MVLGRRWVVKNNFSGLPKETDFELVEEELGELGDRQFLYRSLFISVDPYQRNRVKTLTLPNTMVGSSLARVEKSTHPKYPVGCQVILYAGWVEVGISSPDAPAKAYSMPPMVAPDCIGDLSPSLLLGACGMPGNSAYFGLLEICQPREGETVVVSGAAGAVGSLVGQIAKLKGCRVIGYAGSEDKCSWLKSIGFDFAFNYKNVSVAESLKEAAPEGVDCYFDNVGGEMSTAVMAAMNSRGRISVCGAISRYNDEGGNTGIQGHTDKLAQELRNSKMLKVEGWIVTRWMDRWMEGVNNMASWITAGDIKVKETVVEGFEKTPEAFIGLFIGENTGKMVVKT